MITEIIPMSYNQERMLDINFETALTIINQRAEIKKLHT